MKKWMAVLLAFALVISLAACGGGDDEKAPSNEDKTPSSSQQKPQSTPAPTVDKPEETDDGADAEEDIPFGMAGFLGTKTGRFYSQFADGRMYMEYEMEMEGQTMTMISATNGEKNYSETRMGGAAVSASVMDGETMYVIDHASKMVIKMSLGANAQTIAGAVLEESDVDMGGFQTGTREIDGKIYDTEELIVEGASAIYCFAGDDLVYIISSFEGQEAVMKIVEATDKVDDSLFEIPADYTMMELYREIGSIPDK